jgi:hypothetical protein
VLVADGDPFEGGAVAEAVVIGGGGDAAEEQEVVVAVLGVVEDGVGGVEDVPLEDIVVGLLGAEFGKSPVGDFLAVLLFSRRTIASLLFTARRISQIVEIFPCR